jgi:hypothetical protein
VGEQADEHMGLERPVSHQMRDEQCFDWGGQRRQAASDQEPLSPCCGPIPVESKGRPRRVHSRSFGAIVLFVHGRDRDSQRGRPPVRVSTKLKESENA